MPSNATEHIESGVRMRVGIAPAADEWPAWAVHYAWVDERNASVARHMEECESSRSQAET